MDFNSPVLTSFYIDRKFHIRGTEAYLLDGSGNIMAQEDADQLIKFLTNHIIELQAAYDDLTAELREYKQKED